MKTYNSFDDSSVKALEAETKVGILGTVNPEGLPHITLITAIKAKSKNEIIWGQFIEGMSKKNVTTNPKVGFMMMTLDRNLWRGKALYTHKVTEGEDYVMFNNQTMFRYNSYFGIHTVHYMDLIETYGKEALPLAKIIPASMMTMVAKTGLKTGVKFDILKPWATGLFSKMDSLKFMSFIRDDGFPAVIPIIQCQASDSRRLVFSTLPFKEELEQAYGKQVAVLGLTMSMEGMVVRGVLGKGKSRGVQVGTIDIEWVYNSMPPAPCQIYPEVDLKPVTEF